MTQIPIIIPPNKVAFLPALESVRGLAALYVVLHHISSNSLGLKHSLIGQPFRFGLEAVLVFFVLSGFVISHATESRDAICWKTYIWLRIRRIYPVFLVALLLSFVIACISKGEFLRPNWLQLAGNLVMMHDMSNKPGVWCLPFGDNFPLWSLSYEMTFYVLYIPLMIHAVRKSQLAVATALSWGAVAINQLMPNPWCNFVSFLIIWWVGVEMAREYRACGKLSWGRQCKLAMVLFPPFVFYGYLIWKLRQAGGTGLSFAAHPILQARFYGETILILLILPLAQGTRLSRWLGRSQRLIWLGSISYALYALHFPIICHLHFTRSYPISAVLSMKLFGLFALAWLIEKRFQPWLNRLTSSMNR